MSIKQRKKSLVKRRATLSKQGIYIDRPIPEELLDTSTASSVYKAPEEQQAAQPVLHIGPARAKPHPPQPRQLNSFAENHHRSSKQRTKTELSQQRSFLSFREMPAPPRAEGCEDEVCEWCQQRFEGRVPKAPGSLEFHRRICQKMPFDLWLGRSRMVEAALVPNADCACEHCGTKYSTPRGKVGHRNVCTRHRLRCDLPLHTNEYHEIDPQLVLFAGMSL